MDGSRSVKGWSGLRQGCWASRVGLVGRVGPSWVGLSGAQEGQAAVAVELEQVVDRALEAPLRAGGLFAA